ncbi:LOW QUALITY PROTEIN: uncharacterized protein LOC143315073 [Chaetodon auriga]|uniref:LOW QUALITY PROTEIN: uncharacterized protein LOC143315073 n=1 Tax=Chaetodon auriga TaxID=39042 RepID=UPI004032FDCA
MFLTETWLGQDNTAAVLNESAPPNFSFRSEVRMHKRGGGVAILFNDSIQFSRVSYGEFESFEYVAIQSKSPCRLVFITIYKPPKYNTKFSDEFANLLSVVCIDFDCVVLVGDFNIHVDNLKDGCAKELLNILDHFGLSQHVTHSTHNKGHILDLVISKGLNITEVVVTDVALSDHYCVSFKMATPAILNKTGTEVIKKRYINDNTCAVFTQSFTPSPTLPSALTDDLVNSFSSKVMTIIDCIAPVKTKVLSGRKKTPWRNTTLVKVQKRVCRQGERRWRKTKLQVHYEIYKNSLHTYNHELNMARQAFFSEIINRNCNNARTLFSVVDRLTNPTASVPPELLSNKSCNEFAAFFTDKISRIRQTVCSSSSGNMISPSVPSCSPVNLAHFNLLDHTRLTETVSQLKSTTCCLDTLPTNFFKNVFNCIAPDVLQIINNSLQSGHFPQALKTAVIKPLLKKTNLDASAISNYRPISNLPFLGKIIERVVFQQMHGFVMQNNLFNAFQSGFRPHHSTETVLYSKINDIHLNNDASKTSVLVLLDLSAAFDTVDHDILLDRLEKWVGLTGTVLHWFKSYLQDRDYFVSIGEHVSERKKMMCGVPQGSILGPLLFNIYMLPLAQIMEHHNVSYHTYADDTQLYISVSSHDYSPLLSLSECIHQINEWMCQNFRQLNADKREVIVFGPKNERSKISAHLNSMSLTKTDKARNLGVIIDSDLNFNNHLKLITKSAYYHLKNITRIKGCLSKEDMEKLVHAFIFGRLDYCNGVFTGLNKKSIRPLQLIQNAAARVLTNTRKMDHITPVLRSLHWLSVSQRIDFKILLLVYKALNGLGLKYILDLLTPYEVSRPLRSSGTGLLCVPRMRTKQSEAAFSYYAPHLWNTLPAHLRSAPTVSSFKSGLKTLLFATAFT